MTDLVMLKESIISYCEEYVASQIKHVQDAINSAQESAKNESKSSAGDKHETGKSLMQLEQENHAQHLNKMLGMKRILKLLRQTGTGAEAQIGSLVNTSNGVYFIGLGIGVVKIEGQECFLISPSAPVGKLFTGKNEGDSIQMNQKTIEILNLI